MKLVLLPTDLALWMLVMAGLLLGLHARRHAPLRAAWRKVGRDAAAASAALVLAAFLLIALLDSVHFRRALPPAPGQPASAVVFAPHAESLLDLVLARPLAMREDSYSQPLALHAQALQPLVVEGRTVQAAPRLAHAGRHLPGEGAALASAKATDQRSRAALGLAGGLATGLSLALAAAWWEGRQRGGIAAGWQAVLGGGSPTPWRALIGTATVLSLAAGLAIALAGDWHLFGTDRTGNDVLVQALKSIRTAFVIGGLSTLATLPLALALGIMAGWHGGWVDEVVQYLYTLLGSVPNVLLIAACVLMVQVALDKHPDAFATSLERADVKVLMLCLILGLTGWTQLCRLVRAETLKLRELEYVQAAIAFGLTPARIMLRHILPNVMHLVLITTVLGFSDLVLYEAVLTYVGVGVDPGTASFGSMINGARNEMARDPLVWWSFAAAFAFMVALVLAANLFADGVRDAFDPRSATLRPRRVGGLPSRWREGRSTGPVQP